MSTRWVDAVVFDCDGVLADSDEGWWLTEVLFCREWGIERQDLVVTTHGVSMHEAVTRLLGGVPDLDIAAATDRFMEIAAQTVPAHARALPGATDAVRRLAERCPVGVASNSPRVVLDPLLVTIGVQHLLTASVAGDEVARPKPAPDIYHEACRLLDVAPNAALVFEDSPAGARAAETAGCHVQRVQAPGRDNPAPEAALGTQQMASAAERRIRGWEDGRHGQAADPRGEGHTSATPTDPLLRRHCT